MQLKLGSNKQAGQAEMSIPKNEKEELQELKTKVDAMAKMIYMLRQSNKVFKTKEELIQAQAEEDEAVNKDGIPLNSCYVGITKKSEHPFILIVNENGEYVVGNDKFHSLSAAAEAVSGVRRSGWAFWSTLDGIPLKELYGK